MNDSGSTSAEVLLAEALAGSQERFGELLHVYRNYLKLLVTAQLGSKLRRRVSPSDVVQETFLEASRDFPQFRGSSSREFGAWLRQILVHNLHRVVEQHVLAGKRDVRREVSLETFATAMDQSTARLESILPAGGASPSGALQQREQEIVLANQLARLPADYRDAIVLRHLEGLPFEQVGERMERSPGAARMLWLRGIKLLREQLDSQVEP